MSNDIPMIVMERRHTWFVGEEKQEEHIYKRQNFPQLLNPISIWWFPLIYQLNIKLYDNIWYHMISYDHIMFCVFTCINPMQKKNSLAPGLANPRLAAPNAWRHGVTSRVAKINAGLQDELSWFLLQ